MIARAVDTRYLVRDLLIAELLIRAHAWRNQEDEARRSGQELTARINGARASVLEQFAKDLDDRSLALGEGGSR